MLSRSVRLLPLAALLLAGCLDRPAPAPGPELARFSALDPDGESIGEAVLRQAAGDEGVVLEDLEVRDEDGRTVIELGAALDRNEHGGYRSRFRFQRSITETEVDLSQEELRWRMQKGLAVHRNEVAERDAALLSWPVSPEDTVAGSVLLWRELARRLSIEEHSEKRLSAFNTRRGRLFDLFVSHRESRELSWNDEKVLAHRFFANTRATGHTLWVAADTGELLSVDGVLGTTMVREGFDPPAREVEPLPPSLVAEPVTLSVAVPVSSATACKRSSSVSQTA
ncbi:MAG: hypothetical protein ACOCVR_00945, partial [Myxococcota bacterium]